MTNRQEDSVERLSSRQRLLLVTVSVPPALTGVAFVVENLSRAFDPSELVIAAQRNPGTRGFQRDAGLPEIHYIDTEWTWPKRGRKYVRWARWLFLPILAWRIARLARRTKCGAIMGVFPDEIFLAAAYLAARRCRVKFYPYYHNTYLDNRRGWEAWLARRLQPRTFAYADTVFVMSEGMQVSWERLYPGVHFEPLTHTFDGDAPTYSPLPPPQATVRAAFLGNLNESNLDAMSRFRQIINESPEYEMTIFSGTPAWLFEKVGVCGRGIRHDQVSDEELVATLRRHDLLILPHGFSGGLTQIEYDTIFPTRTIPYLLSGRPIIAHAPPDCFLTRWLRRHDCAEVVDVPDVNLLRAAMDRLCRDAARRDQLSRNALEAVRQFHAPRVAQRLRAVLRESPGPKHDARGLSPTTTH